MGVVFYLQGILAFCRIAGMAKWNEFFWGDGTLWEGASAPPLPGRKTPIMADPKSKRLSPKILKADEDALAAIKKMTDYTPANSDFILTKLTPIETALGNTHDVERDKENAAANARDAACAAEWAYHDFAVGARKQVVAQYGEDSSQVQDVGMKRKSERAKPKRKSSKTPPA
jgi:hypothetical protein